MIVHLGRDIIQIRTKVSSIVSQELPIKGNAFVENKIQSGNMEK